MNCLFPELHKMFQGFLILKVQSDGQRKQMKKDGESYKDICNSISKKEFINTCTQVFCEKLRDLLKRHRRISS